MPRSKFQNAKSLEKFEHNVGVIQTLKQVEYWSAEYNIVLPENLPHILQFVMENKHSHVFTRFTVYDNSVTLGMCYDVIVSITSNSFNQFEFDTNSPGIAGMVKRLNKFI